MGGTPEVDLESTSGWKEWTRHPIINCYASVTISWMPSSPTEWAFKHRRSGGS